MISGSSLAPPEPLRPEHDLSAFYCGEPVLDDWLRRLALKNEAQGACRTYVVCETDSRVVIAYYCLATGAVARAQAPARISRNMPDPVPVMVLGRLAVDHRWQSRGLGSGLLRDAVFRTLQAADIAGIRAMLVHAISEEARSFYERCGFKPSRIDPLTLMLRLSDAKGILEGLT